MKHITNLYRGFVLDDFNMYTRRQQCPLSIAPHHAVLHKSSAIAEMATQCCAFQIMIIYEKYYETNLSHELHFAKH